MKKKLLTVLLTLIATLCLCLGLVGCDGKDGKDGIGIQSVEVDENGDLKVTLDDGTVLNAGKVTADGTAAEGTEDLQYQKIKGEDGEYTVAVVGLGTAWDTDIVIPSTYRGLKVTTIGNNAFNASMDARSANLTSITIPDSVTSIGNNAFSGCSGLTGELKIPDSVTSIGISAFRNCSSLESINIPDKVTSIGESAFSGCSGLTSVTIGSGVTSIGYRAFDGCSSLESIEIPNSVTSIGDWAFYECSSLESINIPDGVTSIGDYAFSGCSEMTEITLPFIHRLDDIFGYPPSDPGKFVPKSLKKVNITGGETISDSAFQGCSSLESITIPDSVIEIGERAFFGCSSLESIEIPSSVTSIGDRAFSGCYRLVEVWNYSELPITVGDTGNGRVAYYAKHVYTTNEESKQVLTEDGYLFYEDENESYLLAYRGDETNLSLPAKSSKGRDYQINQGAFYGCSSLESINIPYGVTSIGSYAFSGCSGLTRELKIPDSVTSIGDYAFSGCSSLESIKIPNSVTSIGEDAFKYCSGLTSVYISDLSAWCKIDFEGGTSNPLNCAHHLYVDNVELKELVIPNGISEIKPYAFYDCDGLTSITIHDGVTSIGDYAFSGCSGLTSITIPDSVTSIGNYAFRGCSSLESMTVQGSTTWQVSQRSDFASAKTLNVTDPAKYVDYFTYDYVDYYWKRSV